jgi:eukaryotic-like serine/threonine-protein kinase
MTQHTLAPGTMLSGRYRLGELIGQSDLSCVYAAEDLRSQTEVALKVLDRAVVARPVALSECQAQARQASSLGVEGVARAYDFGIDGNTGLAFSTAERVTWASLDRRVLSQGPLGAVELARALSILARALDAAHVAGVVHRDLKPQNVFISPDNAEWVRITDFGVSALRRGAPEASGWGGPTGYTAPEAVDAHAPSRPSADLFALGLLAFFALTRGTPFRSLRGPSFDPAAHWAELNQPLYPISERARELGVALDTAFDPWFSRALSPSPGERFGTASDMARELNAVTERLTYRGSGATLALPGIAAAIAQPLVFHPDTAPGLGRAPAPTSVRPARVQRADASPTLLSRSHAEEPASTTPPARRRALLLALGATLCAGLALGGYAWLAAGDEQRAAPSLSAVDATAAPAPPAPPSAPVEPLTPSAPSAEPPAAAPAPSPPASAPSPAAQSRSGPPPEQTARLGAQGTGAKGLPPSKASSPAATKSKQRCSAFLGCK